MLRLHKTLNLAETNESSMKIFSLDSYKAIEPAKTKTRSQCIIRKTVV